MAKKMRIEEINPGNGEFATIVLILQLVLNSMQTNTKIRAFTFFYFVHRNTTSSYTNKS